MGLEKWLIVVGNSGLVTILVGGLTDNSEVIVVGMLIALASLLTAMLIYKRGRC